MGVGGSVENEILQCLSGFQKILGWVLRKKDNNVEELPDRGRRTGSSKGSNRKHVTLHSFARHLTLVSSLHRNVNSILLLELQPL